MNEPAPRDIRDSLARQPLDFSAEIAALRLAGAERFDPVRLHYLHVLAKRANSQQAGVKRLLDDKLAQALAELRERLAQAQGEARDSMANAGVRYPRALGDLRRLFDAGDFKGVKRFIGSLEDAEPRASLGELVLYMAQHSPEPPAAAWEGDAGGHPELKTTRYFRNTWSKLSVDKQLTQALDQAPRNAGPINSHMLVLRSLALMRDISPDYLNRFTSYVDALLCLHQGDIEKPGPGKKAAEGEHGKKTKSRRSRSR